MTIRFVSQKDLFVLKTLEIIWYLVINSLFN